MVIVHVENAAALVWSGRLCYLGALLLTACLALPYTAHAQDHRVKAMTEDNVTDFILQTAEITSGHVKHMSQGDVTQYLQRHLHKDAHFKSEMSYVIPGWPAQTSEMRLDKKEFIESIEKGSQAMDDYDSYVEVDSIRIARDKQTATVKTISRESGTMPVQGENLPVLGSSECTQILRLSRQNIIQMFNAVCKTEIRFQQTY